MLNVKIISILENQRIANLTLLYKDNRYIFAQVQSNAIRTEVLDVSVRL